MSALVVRVDGYQAEPIVDLPAQLVAHKDNTAVSIKPKMANKSMSIPQGAMLACLGYSTKIDSVRFH